MENCNSDWPGPHQALLLTTGALQLLGLTVRTYGFVNEELGGKHEGLELSISPIAGGRLGLALKLTGF